MYLDTETHLALHHARTDRAAADPRWSLPRRARPPGRLRSRSAAVLRSLADRLAREPVPGGWQVNDPLMARRR